MGGLYVITAPNLNKIYRYGFWAQVFIVSLINDYYRPGAVIKWLKQKREFSILMN